MLAFTGARALDSHSVSSHNSSNDSLPQIAEPPVRKAPSGAVKGGIASADNPFARSSGKKSHKALVNVSSSGSAMSTPPVAHPPADVNPFSRRSGRKTHLRSSAKVVPTSTSSSASVVQGSPAPEKPPASNNAANGAQKPNIAFYTLSHDANSYEASDRTVHIGLEGLPSIPERSDTDTGKFGSQALAVNSRSPRNLSPSQQGSASDVTFGGSDVDPKSKVCAIL